MKMLKGFLLTKASIVGGILPHLPTIDPALGNLIPVGDGFSDEEFHALAGQRSISASLAYNTFGDQYAFIIECQYHNCINIVENYEGKVPMLVIGPPNSILHEIFFLNMSLNMASRVQKKKVEEL